MSVTTASTLSPNLLTINDVDDDLSDFELSSPSESSITSSSPSVTEENRYDRLTFDQFLEARREQYVRKRYIISDKDYDDLISVLKDRTLVRQNPSLKWAATFISSNNLRLKTIQTNSGYNEIVIKPLPLVGVRVPNTSPYRMVVKISQISSIIQTAHESGSHCGYERTFKRVTDVYCCVTRELVKQFTQRCQTCVDLRANKAKKNRPPLQPIISKNTFHHILIDLIDYSNKPAGPNGEYRYIIHAIDHYSSYRFAEPALSKSADEVFRFVRRLFSFIGFPVILHTDNGTEFKNSILEKYLQDNEVEFRHGKPYTPTTQGKIERANRTLKMAISKTIRGKPNTLDWYSVLYDAVYSINTNISSSTKKTPYEVVFCQAPHMRGKNRINIGAESEPQMASIDSNPIEKDDEDCDFPIPEANIDDLHDHAEFASHSRINVNTNLAQSRNIMKQNYDKKFKLLLYNIGDIVGILVPDEYKVKSISNLVPAVVIGYHDIDGYKYYLLGYNYQVIKGKFNSSSLVKLPIGTYAGFVGDKNDILNDHSIYSSWGVVENGYDYISLENAYKHYLDILTAQNNMEDDLDQAVEILAPSSSSDPPNSKSEDSSIMIDKHDDTDSDTNNMINLCKICELPINSDSIILRCFRCNCTMHGNLSGKSQCTYGITQFHDVKSGGIYCSMACFRNWSRFEVEIYGASNKYYKVKYNNGDLGKISKSKADKLAEYYKLVTIYKKKQASSPIVIDDSNSIDSSPKLSRSLSSQSEPPPLPKVHQESLDSSKSSSRVCIVCMEALSMDNWKVCHACGGNMHGKIICKQGKRIIDDDGTVYCSKKCKLV
jgi:hypothetical protein